MALRRWKPFLGAFEHIDDAIEAADPGGRLSRDEFRGARARIVELLCDAAGDEDGGESAEALCALLDEAMAGSLATLRAVPSEVIAPCLLACGDLVGAVGDLAAGHGSERVRRLARGVASGWRAAVEARARAAMDLLDSLPSTPPPPALHDDTAPAAATDTKPKKEAKIPEEEEQPHPKKKTAAVTSRGVRAAESHGPVLSKKTAPVVTTSRKQAKPSADKEAPRTVPAQPEKPPPAPAVSAAEDEKKMEATKRKLHEGYQEAEDAKRRRTIQVIKPPPRLPASCAAERRRFMKPSWLGRRV